MTATELTGKARSQALKEFQSGSGWLRADDLDRLSEEEAGIIATRLVRRLEAKAPLAQGKAGTLRGALADILTKRFLALPDAPLRTPEQERDAFLESAASYLNATELAALREAIASGLQPLPGEK